MDLRIEKAARGLVAVFGTNAEKIAVTRAESLRSSGVGDSANAWRAIAAQVRKIGIRQDGVLREEEVA